MSSKYQARRAKVAVYFDGVDISKSLRDYLLSLTYTDYEEDKADDLQISIHDRDDVWLTKWLNAAIQSAISGSSQSSTSAFSGEMYKVIAKGGLNVRKGAGTSYAKLGSLPYGTEIKVTSTKDGWATTSYSGQTAYVSAQYLTKVNTSTSSASSGSSKWAVGDAVTVSGRPQYTSYGDGKPGKEIKSHQGKITHLNLKSGVSYPICVDYLGWFKESQVQKAGGASAGAFAADNASKGLRIQAVIIRENWHGDGKDDVLDCGQFELDSVSASGPPSSIQFKSTALPFRSNVRQTKKNKAWESRKLSSIANEIAGASGMTCLYESSNDPAYGRVEQVAESDIALLSRLCRNAGISLKATNNILVLFDQKTYEAKSPILVITKRKDHAESDPWKDCGYISYRLDTGTANVQYACCRVRYTNPATGEVIEATAYVEDYDEKKKNNQCLEITAKVSSIGEAQALAAKRLRAHNKFEYSISFTFPGDPRLIAGITMLLSGWGGWDGKYIISEAKHTVGSSGYTTTVKLRRVLEGY